MSVIFKLSLVIAAVAVSWYFICRNKQLPPTQPTIFAAPGWQKVADVFRKQIESGWQEGGAFSVYHKGKLVLEAVGGYADDDIFLEWTNETVSQYFSSVKGVVAVLMAMLVDRGLLDYNKPVSHYWPEFAQNGKEDITVEQLLGHQAGLPVIDVPYSFEDVLTDDKKISRILAAQKPLWKPGTMMGYHAITYGLYADQILKRVDPKGRSIHKYFHEEVRKPFDIDMYIGLPKEENYRCARNYYAKIHTIEDYLGASLSGLMIKYMEYQDTMFYRSITNPKNMLYSDRHFNQPRNRESPCGSTHGFGTATALAKFYGILANGGIYNGKTLLNAKYIEMLQKPLINETDVLIQMQWAMGRGVVVFDTPHGGHAFGTVGAGGQMGMSDPDNQLGIAYITNHMVLTLIDPRFIELRDAVWETLEEP